MGAFRGMGLVTGSASRAAEGRRTRRLGSGSSCWSLLCRLAPTRDRPAVLCGGGLLGFDRRLGEQAPEAAGEVALEAAQRSLVGLALGLFAREIFLRGGVVLGAGDRDRVQRPVELAVTAAVEAVFGSLPGGAWDRGGAGLAAEACV